jgi:hypothetical protein
LWATQAKVMLMRVNTAACLQYVRTKTVTGYHYYYINNPPRPNRWRRTSVHVHACAYVLVHLYVRVVHVRTPMLLRFIIFLVSEFLDGRFQTIILRTIKTRDGRTTQDGSTVPTT